MSKKHHEEIRNYIRTFYDIKAEEGEKKAQIYNLENAYYFSFDMIIEMDEQSAFMHLMLKSDLFTQNEKDELKAILKQMQQSVHEYRSIMDAKSRNLKGGDNV